MPTYNLSQPESDILISWLFEPSGYLDQAFNDGGITAHQALIANSSLDVYAWITTNTRGANCSQSDWNECAMVWWLWKHDNVNIQPNRWPPETAAWKSYLLAWGASIDAAFARVSQIARDDSSITLYDQNGVVVGSLKAGQQLAHQKNIVSKITALMP